MTIATEKPTDYAKPVTPEDLLSGARAADAILELQRREEADGGRSPKGADPTSPASFFSGLLFGKGDKGDRDTKSKS